MIRRDFLLRVVFAGLGVALGAPGAARAEVATRPPVSRHRPRVDVSALKARAAANGRVRVLVVLDAGRRATPRHVAAVQRIVVVATLGAAAWRRRRAGEIHGVSTMNHSAMFAASVTAAELDRLAAHRRVRRIGEDSPAPPAEGGFAKPQ